MWVVVHTHTHTHIYTHTHTRTHVSGCVLQHGRWAGMLSGVLECFGVFYIVSLFDIRMLCEVRMCFGGMCVCVCDIIYLFELLLL